MLGGSRKRLRDLLLETIVAVAIVVALVVYSRKINFKWLAFFANTAVIFGYAVRILQPLWKKTKFWAVLAALLLLHLAIGGYAISRVEEIALIWYVPLIPAEIFLICVVVQRTNSEEELVREDDPS